MSAPTTAAFAGGLAATYALLQMRVGLYRKDNGIFFGSGDAAVVADAKAKQAAEDLKFTCMVRAGANMGEYVPMGLLVMFLLETQTAISKPALLAYGAILAIGRLSHALALTTFYLPAWKKPHLLLRAGGFISTIGCILSGGLYLLHKAKK